MNPSKKWFYLIISFFFFIPCFADSQTWEFIGDGLDPNTDNAYALSDVTKIQVANDVAKLIADTKTNVATSDLKITASSTKNGTSTEDAIDGNTNSSWQTNESTDDNPQWIMIDLGASYSISEVILKYDNGYHAVDYEIQISESGLGDEWATIAGESGNYITSSAGSLDPEQQGSAHKALDDDDQTTKWKTNEPVAIFPQSLELDLGDAVDIQQIHVIFDNQNEAVDFKYRVSDTKTGPNIAKGATSYVSSGENKKGNVNDGDPGDPDLSEWTSGDVTASTPQYVILDLGESKNVVYYEVYFDAANYGTTYEFEISTTTEERIETESMNVSHSSKNGGNSGSKAFDNNLSSYWETKVKTNDSPQWVSVDMGNGTTIKQIELEFGSGFHGVDYNLQISDDNASWTDIQSVSGNSSTSLDYTGLNTTGRYFRFYCTKSANSNSKTGLRVNDIKLYSDRFDTGKQIITWDQVIAPENFGTLNMQKRGFLAQIPVSGQYVRLNMTESNNDGPVKIKNITLRETHFDQGPVEVILNPPNGIVGNNQTELTHDSTTNPALTKITKQYFQMYVTKTNVPLTANALQVYEFSMYPSDGTFGDDSLDPLAAITGNTSSTTTDVIDPVQIGRYVRLWVTKSANPANSTGLRVAEFEIYASTFQNGDGSVITQYFQPTGDLSGWGSLVVDNNSSENMGTITVSYKTKTTSSGESADFVNLGSVIADGFNFDLSGIAFDSDGNDEIQFKFDLSAGADINTTPVLDQAVLNYNFNQTPVLGFSTDNVLGTVSTNINFATIPYRIKDDETDNVTTNTWQYSVDGKLNWVDINAT